MMFMFLLQPHRSPRVGQQQVRSIVICFDDIETTKPSLPFAARPVKNQTLTIRDEMLRMLCMHAQHLSEC